MPQHNRTEPVAPAFAAEWSTSNTNDGQSKLRGTIHARCRTILSTDDIRHLPLLVNPSPSGSRLHLAPFARPGEDKSADQKPWTSAQWRDGTTYATLGQNNDWLLCVCKTPDTPLLPSVQPPCTNLRTASVDRSPRPTQARRPLVTAALPRLQLLQKLRMVTSKACKHADVQSEAREDGQTARPSWVCQPRVAVSCCGRARTRLLNSHRCRSGKRRGGGLGSWCWFWGWCTIRGLHRACGCRQRRRRLSR